MQNLDILENYPKHMPLQCNFIFKPYVQVFTELPFGFFVFVRLRSKGLEAAPTPNWFRPKPQVPNLPGHLPRVSYICFGTPGIVHRFPGICLTTEENPKKPQLGKHRGALSSMIGRCFKWGHFPPSEVDRAMLLAPLVKHIQVCPQKHALKIEICDTKI